MVYHNEFYTEVSLYHRTKSHLVVVNDLLINMLLDVVSYCVCVCVESAHTSTEDRKMVRLFSFHLVLKPILLFLLQCCEHQAS